MFIARLLYPVEVLGPGRRIGIWFAGCKRHCPGCSNPELWVQRKEWQTDADGVMKLVHLIADRHPVDGFTLTGGDPFEQEDALRKLLPMLEQVSKDILVYTGYCLDELKEACEDLLPHMAVLIDGPYIEEQNRGAVLKGSENQHIHVLKAEYAESYAHYIHKEAGGIQNFMTRDGMISVGIHKPGYEAALLQAARKRGLEEQP